MNFRAECDKYFSQFKQMLCEIDAPFDGLSIHGEMAKEEKFAFINLFTGMRKYSNFDPRILFATSAANIGIDQLETNLVAHVGLFRCLITMLQERGRNTRRLGMTGVFLVFGNWTGFIKLLLTVLSPTNLDRGVEPTEGSLNTRVWKHPPEVMNPCNTQCFVCDESIHHWILQPQGRAMKLFSFKQIYNTDYTGLIVTG